MEPKTPATKEEIYDAKINPLMGQILDLCKEHDIPLFATFQLDDQRSADEAALCTSAILPRDAHATLHEAYRVVLRRGRGFMLNTIDASGAVVRSEAIFT